MSNTLTGLIPTIYTALDKVSREQIGFIPAVARDAKADGAAVGQTVTSHVTSAIQLADIEPDVTAPNDGDQNIGTVDVKITKSKMAPIKWNGEEQLAVGPTGQYNKILSDQFAQAFRALSNEVDADLGGLFIGTSRAAGKAGVTPFAQKDDLSDFADTLKILEDNGTPSSDLQMVLGSDATAKIRGKQSVLFKNNEAGTDELLRDGIIGRVESFNLRSSGGVKRFKGGNAAGYLVNGAKQEGDRFIAVDTGTGKFKVGDVVSFAGDNNQYVVAATSAGSITINEPGLRQDLADNAAVTVAGGYVANMAFDRGALLLACRTPAMPEGGDQADDVMDVTDTHSGITFQVALYRQYRQIKFEVGLAWGVKSVAPRHAALILG